MTAQLTSPRAQAIFQADLRKLVHRTDRMFFSLLIFQWLFGITIALIWSPRTWIAEYWSLHQHVIAANLLGALFAAYPLYCIVRQPGALWTRHVIATGQMLQSALLVHVTGGRIETHFHVFGSLALLAFYRDWRVLVTASAVVYLNHLALGFWFPLSVYGVEEAPFWRSAEHGFWVIFEVVFLTMACRTGIQELSAIADRQAETEMAAADLRKHNAEIQTISAELQQANEVLRTEISERQQAQQALQRIEWLLGKTAKPSSASATVLNGQPYGDLVQLNTSRLVLKQVGKDVLADMVTDYLSLLDTSAAVYEKNGDYALGLFSSGWCRFLDQASRSRCGTGNNKEALASGKWHCHESCWQTSKASIDTGQAVDLPCSGGIRIHAVPIRAGEDIVGSINFGYGDPPRDPKKLQEIADRYGVSLDDLRAKAAAYESRPPVLIEDAKKRLQTTAKLMGAIIERRQAEEVSHRLNVELEQRVSDRTAELAHAVEDLQSEITGRKRASEALLKAEEQLRQAQKMEAVGRLAGGIAHDFNNLLTVINGFGEVVHNNLRPNDPSRPLVAEIKKSGERAADLTRQLLAFSRKQILAPQLLDLNAVVTNMDKMLRRVIGEDIQLILALDPALNRVQTDLGQLEQVLMNLVVNSRDAMPRGGKLTIETGNVELDETCARTRSEVGKGSYVMLAVSDTGCGMDANTQAHIFEPFFTTKGPGKGTGLGLSTVYGIIKQSGGHIYVYSEPGHGTTMKIYLPQIEEIQPLPSANGGHGDRVRGGTETILLVEDEAGVRYLARHALQSKGYTVLEASSGGEALQLCQQPPQPIHLLLTDVIMPEMSGRQLADQLTLCLPLVKILFMSGYTDDAIVHHGVLDPDTVLLQKPFTPDVLARKVREVLDSPG